MICIHVQDDADFREKAQKTICIFACFCDKSFRFTYTDISADCRKNPTNTDGRIAVTCKKNMRYHRCCSSFSMCSGNCDRCVVISHDLSKKFCTGKHRNTFFFSTGKLRIVRMNGCGINDYIYTFSNVGCTLSVVDSCSFFLKCLCKRAWFGIWSWDNEILSQKNFCQTAHTDSADADKMYMQRFMKIYLIHF